MRLFLCLPLLLLLLVGAAPVGAAPTLPFVGQQALYGLTLTAPRDGDVVAGSGTMGYEVIDACTGWAVRQRLEMTLVNADGQVTRTRSDYATWEAKDGLSFRFHTIDLTNGEVSDRLAGEAHLDRAGGAGSVTYTEPEQKTLKLPPGTMFPMAQTEAIILAAKAGEKLIAMPLFDGTDADGASDSSVAIAGWTAPRPHRFAELSDLPSTRVNVAFFSRKPSAIVPDFEIGMRYFLNGVADGLAMNFGNFTMLGTLANLSIVPAKC